MKISILRQNQERVEFEAEGITPAFANALRRIMMMEIPTLAIEKVEFHENSSSMFDEMIAHRLGLIPLVFPPEKINRREDCICEGRGCSLCTVVFAVEKTGPCMVYSGDMKSSHKTVYPTHPGFPVVELLDGQRLKLEAIAQLGVGTMHAKWQAANSTYQYHPDLFVDAEVRKEHAAVLKSDPRYVIDKISDTAVRLTQKPEMFIFRVETVSGLEPGYIVLKSAEILEGKAGEFMAQLEKS
jgi:DNA-directed RNA polymerase subunit D